MGYYNQCSPIFINGGSQYFYVLNVKIVCRLIQNNDVYLRI